MDEPDKNALPSILEAKLWTGGAKMNCRPSRGPIYGRELKKYYENFY
jgi:hypothetical protein